MRRAALLAGAAALLLPTTVTSAQDPEPGPARNAPNVVVVMTDDQRLTDMTAIPKIRRLIGDAGVTFTRAYVSYPVCCPARATFLTGQYAQNHRVRCLYPWCGGGYGRLNQREYLPVWLERAGVATAHVGKFLNGYGLERAPDVPNGWTEWYGLVDHSTYRMWGYDIFENGRRRTYGRVRREVPRYYQTDVLTDKATAFIRRRADGDTPFFLSVAYVAPHHESGKTQRLTGKLVRPAPRHRRAFARLPLPKPPGFNERDLSDKPWFIARWNRPIKARRTYGRVRREVPRYYQTDVLTDKATAFIRRRADGDTPFFLSVAYVAPHHESGRTQRLTGKLVRPAPRHRGAFADLPLPKPPGYNESDLSDKPWFIGRWNRPITARREAAIRKRLRERWASLLAVDDGVEAIVEELRRTGELDNTYVIFTSDHGFMQGEHRVPEGKMLPYDPSTQVPLLIRGPGIPRGRRTRALVGDVDLAPTILDATSARAGRALDGRSILPFARNVRRRRLRPLLHTTAGQGARGRTNTREGATRGTQPRVPAWSAVRTTRWLYVEYKGGQRELYDLRRDPWQLNSVVRDPRLRVRIRTLRRILGDLRRCRGRSCDEIAAASVR